MMKVVINECYGGFGLSKEACQRYFDLKGQQVWIEEDKRFSALDMFTVWLVSPEERLEIKEGEAYHKMSRDERIDYNWKYSQQTWYRDNNLTRNDPILVQVVEEMGDKAWGRYAKLAIVEIPDDVQWIIEENDGMEWVAEKHRTWK
jgi:hypothetical protein